jgi:DNA-binding transcriptional regulator YiaG
MFVLYDTAMTKLQLPAKKSPNKSIVALRGILGRTQEQFAALIGVSLDTVRSWELGRNRLNAKQAQRIRMVTGAEIASLMDGNGVVKEGLGSAYNKEYFEYWTKRFARSDAKQADEWCEGAVQSIRLLYAAAAAPDSRHKGRLPALHTSLLEWLDRAYADFKLAPQVEYILKKRKRRNSHTMSYGEWRSAWAAGYREMFSFKNDPQKADDELLRLECIVWPGWSAGSNMTGDKDELDNTALTAKAKRPGV